MFFSSDQSVDDYPLIANIVEEDDQFLFQFEGLKAPPKELDLKPWLVIRHTELEEVYCQFLY